MASSPNERYDIEYARAADDLYAEIRREAFGEEIGQFSWLTADEYRRFFGLLGPTASSKVLEIASGTGGPALFMAAETGCDVTGVDIHQAGVDAGNLQAAERGLAERARFLCADARDELPFDDGAFDAIACIDAINHLYERERVLAEWHRLLRPRGRLLFTDPIVITGRLRREEMIVRSGAMGEFIFTPDGLDERLVHDAGFVDVHSEDVTENMCDGPARHAAARERHAAALIALEGESEYSSLQAFLHLVSTLACERRLSRLAIAATKP